MLATLLRPDAGSARVLGRDIVNEADAVRGLVSLTGQLASVDEDLTGRENLILLGRLLGYSRPRSRERAAELLEAFGLADATNRQVKNYSGGMRRRLDIAASIVVTPELMFLDEPTTGLDPRSRNQVWDIIRALVDQGTTVLLCTQYLDEADQLAVADRRHRPWPGDRRGHARRAQGVGRPGHAARARARPRAARRGRAGARARARRAGAPGVRPGGAVGPGRRLPSGRRTPSPSCSRPASASPTSRSGSRASTRCSWR